MLNVRESTSLEAKVLIIATQTSFSWLLTEFIAGNGFHYTALTNIKEIELYLKNPFIYNFDAVVIDVEDSGSEASRFLELTRMYPHFFSIPMIFIIDTFRVSWEIKEQVHCEISRHEIQEKLISTIENLLDENC